MGICYTEDTLPSEQLQSTSPVHSDSPSLRTAPSLSPPAQGWWAPPASAALQNSAIQLWLMWPGSLSHWTQLTPSFEPRILALRVWGFSVWPELKHLRNWGNHVLSQKEEQRKVIGKESKTKPVDGEKWRDWRGTVSPHLMSIVSWNSWKQGTTKFILLEANEYKQELGSYDIIRIKQC